jgi:hypothetical protein
MNVYPTDENFEIVFTRPRPEGELQPIPKPEFYFSGVGINETSGYS